MTKFYVDANGVYMGGYYGNTGIDVSVWTQIDAPPPIDATQLWNGTEWSASSLI
jgi:hypothetical protein